MVLRALLAALLTSFLAIPVFAECEYPTPVTPETCQAAANYNASTDGVALLVWVNGELVCEDYRPGGGPEVSQEIWSGTKSFWGVIATAAMQDGIIAIDELVSDTITEWQSDDWKKLITVRQLLNLTSGLQADLPGEACPTYAEAIQAPALYEPGTHWEYGAVQYQCFGEFMRRKLEPEYNDPLEYLEARILNRIDAHYAYWTYGDDGYPQLPQGSEWTAPEWIKYGELVRLGGWWPDTSDRIVYQDLMDECFHPSDIKPTYGVTWWLPTPGNPDWPCDAVTAMGAGSQRLYVIRSLKLVAVRQTPHLWSGLTFSDTTFLDFLLAPENPQDDCPPAEVQDLLVTRVEPDLYFDWLPVNEDITGNRELLKGYELWKATEPDFSDGFLQASTKGPIPALLALGEGGDEEELVYYQVLATDKCSNTGP
jgi:CubicO group peptidase (beta-lactamase class C family)